MRPLREDLKKRNEELVQAIGKCIIIDKELRSREEEVEVSKAVEAARRVSVLVGSPHRRGCRET